MVRLVINLAITSALILFYQFLGWIDIQRTVNFFDNHDANKLAVVVVIAIFFSLGVWLFEVVTGLFVAFTFGLGCLILPVLIFAFANIAFWVLNQLLPGWVVVNANAWQVLAMALLVSIVRVPKSE